MWVQQPAGTVPTLREKGKSLSPWSSKRELLRFAIYWAIGAVAILANFGSKSMAEFVGVPLIAAGPVGYLVGGQVNFFLHNGVTWRDRHPTMEGWRRRWVLFMTGNLVGLIIYTTAIMSYTKLGATAVAAFFAALCTSAVFNWLWNHHLAFAHHPLDPPEEEVSC